MSIDLRNRRVLVTGGTGFLGRHLCSALGEAGAIVLTASSNLDLTWGPCVNTLFSFSNRPIDYVFHLAGYNGGIAFNQAAPADIFYRNTVMGLNVLTACHAYGVKKAVSVVASCAYPEQRWAHFMDDPRFESRHPEEGVMFERDFLDGPPHQSVACHGYAKRNLQLASRFYRQQYGLNAVCACPTTLYGPGDSYDPDRTKVMGGMVKRFVDAADNGDRQVACWGSGKPMREFLYVEDAAKLLVQTMLHYDDSEMPLNLGTGQEFAIKEVAETVAKAAGFSGDIKWDTSKPDGQHRKRLDLTRMQRVLPEFEPTPFEEGVHRTVEDYRRRK